MKTLRPSGDSRARVLMVVENSGYVTDPRVRAEALALTAAGYDVTVIAPNHEARPRAEMIDGVRVRRYPPPPEGDGLWAYLREYLYATTMSLLMVVRMLLGRGFDVIHLHNPPDTLWVAAVPAKLVGKRVIFDHHDLAPELYDAIYGPSARRAVRWVLLLLERATFRLADHVISTNESYREIAIARGHVPRRRITVVRNGPDLQRVRLVAPDADLRARAGTIVGYVGLMARQDGVDRLLHAVRHLVHVLDRRDVLFMLIGYGDELDQLKRLAGELEIERWVWFTGKITDDELFRRYLSTADLCVTPDPATPYTEHSTMIKMMEYMALGKATVAFDLRENQASAGDAAVYVPGNDSAAFAEAIAALMDDPARREEMGRIGRQRVESGLSWAHSVPHLLAAYEAVLSSPPRGLFRRARAERRTTRGPA
ncbi:MAG: glycosyltransferase family 4 protein [Gemmatimonadota bacterium]|nr:glycosyltransferase family 4 protein [Gemmatimonadota bacterium]